ncbi:unnamed protein product, partial [marine sediment metagenome]
MTQRQTEDDTRREDKIARIFAERSKDKWYAHKYEA